MGGSDSLHWDLTTIPEPVRDFRLGLLLALASILQLRQALLGSFLLLPAFGHIADYRCNPIHLPSLVINGHKSELHGYATSILSDGRNCEKIGLIRSCRSTSLFCNPANDALSVARE